MAPTIWNTRGRGIKGNMVTKEMALFAWRSVEARQAHEFSLPFKILKISPQIKSCSGLNIPTLGPGTSGGQNQELESRISSYFVFYDSDWRRGEMNLQSNKFYVSKTTVLISTVTAIRLRPFAAETFVEDKSTKSRRVLSNFKSTRNPADQKALQRSGR